MKENKLSREELQSELNRLDMCLKLHFDFGVIKEDDPDKTVKEENYQRCKQAIEYFKFLLTPIPEEKCACGGKIEFIKPGGTGQFPYYECQKCLKVYKEAQKKIKEDKLDEFAKKMEDYLIEIKPIPLWKGILEILKAYDKSKVIK